MSDSINMDMSDYSKEEAEYALRLLEVFRGLRTMGINEVTAATVMTAMGVHVDDIPQDAYTKKYFLTEAFLENEEMILAALQSRVETKQ